MRALEHVVAAVLLAVTVLAAITTLYSYMIVAEHLIAHKVQAASAVYVPSTMELNASGCSGGVAEAWLTVRGFTPKELVVVSDHSVYLYKFNGSSVSFKLPCRRTAILVIDSRGYIHPYTARSDPRLHMCDFNSVFTPSDVERCLKRARGASRAGLVSLSLLRASLTPHLVVGIPFSDDTLYHGLRPGANVRILFVSPLKKSLETGRVLVNGDKYYNATAYYVFFGDNIVNSVRVFHRLRAYYVNLSAYYDMYRERIVRLKPPYFYFVHTSTNPPKLHSGVIAAVYIPFLVKSNSKPHRILVALYPVSYKVNYTSTCSLSLLCPIKPETIGPELLGSTRPPRVSIKLYYVDPRRFDYRTLIVEFFRGVDDEWKPLSVKPLAVDWVLRPRVLDKALEVVVDIDPARIFKTISGYDSVLAVLTIYLYNSGFSLYHLQNIARKTSFYCAYCFFETYLALVNGIDVVFDVYVEGLETSGGTYIAPAHVSGKYVEAILAPQVNITLHGDAPPPYFNPGRCDWAYDTIRLSSVIAGTGTVGYTTSGGRVVFTRPQRAGSSVESYDWIKYPSLPSLLDYYLSRGASVLVLG